MKKAEIETFWGGGDRGGDNRGRGDRGDGERGGGDRVVVKGVVVIEVAVIGVAIVIVKGVVVIQAYYSLINIQMRCVKIVHVSRSYRGRGGQSFRNSVT